MRDAAADPVTDVERGALEPYAWWSLRAATVAPVNGSTFPLRPRTNPGTGRSRS
jgi:hypothetical protein